MKMVLLLLLGLLAAPAALAVSPIPAALVPAKPAPAAHAATAPATTEALTPAQAQSVLAVLTNDQKRQQLVAVLQNIARLQAAQAPKGPINLTPGSVGAEIIAGLSTALAAGSAQLFGTVRTLTDFALFRHWVLDTASDPASRDRLADAAWKLAVILLLAGLAEYATTRLVRRWREHVHGAAPNDTASQAVPPPIATPSTAGGPDADQEHSHALPARPTAWGLLKRIPYAVLQVAIGLLPVAAFTLVSYGALETKLGAQPDTRLVVLGVINATIVVQAALTLARAILAPHSTPLRLIHVSDASANYLVRWIRRVLVVAVFGYALDQTALLFGMYSALHDALLKVIALVLHIFALIMVLQCRRVVARRLRAPRGAPGAWAMLCNRFAESWHVIAIFLIIAFWVVSAFEVRQGYAAIWRGLGVAALVLVAARLASIVLTGALDRAMRLQPETLERYPGLDQQANRYQPLLHGAINLALMVIVAAVLLHDWGVPVNDWASRGTLGQRLLSAAGTSALVIVVAVLAWEGSNTLIQRRLARLARNSEFDRSARLRTLLPMLRTTLMATIFIFASLMVLSQIGVNTAPLLAGAGVLGIAIGFGSQKLVQDVITGLFLLLENAVQVGDTASLAGLTGTVENLSIRTIRLRAVDGAVHLIPFSAVTTVTNSTRDYGYAVLDITAGYNEEPDHIANILRAVAKDMREDPRWTASIEDDIDVQGVDKFMDNAWVLRARVKTLPNQRVPVQREFNRRLKYRFDKLAIESPFTSPRILSSNPPPVPDAQQPAEEITR